MIDWREVDLGGATVEGLSNTCHYGKGILVRGVRGGRPFAARIAPDGTVTTASPRWTGTVTSVMQDDGGDLWVTGGSPPRNHPHDDPEEWAAPDPHDPFVRGWVEMGDEDACNVALTTAGQLYAYEYGGESPTVGPALSSAASADDLVVAGAEIGLVVAGPLRGPPPVGAWRYANEQWGVIGVAAPLDAYTDAYTRWEPVLAGHRAGRPQVHSHSGTPLPAPQVDLDPASPRVCVAHVDGPVYGSEQRDWTGRLALVVQAVEGVQVWLQHDRGWTMLPGPTGRLSAARLGYNEKDVAWVVVGGRLWRGDLSAVWDAIT